MILGACHPDASACEAGQDQISKTNVALKMQLVK
jgi:hypothetical protein